MSKHADPMKDLPALARDRKLVSIRRDQIDGNSIQGFILGFSDELLLIQYVYDFRLDGLMVLRTADITAIKCGATDEFQKDLLITEQLFREVDFDSSFDLRDWRSILTQFSGRYRLIILEDEQPGDGLFLIGEIQKIAKNNAWLRHFSGAGNWDREPTKLPFSRITSCQVGTNYLNVYQRHFERSECGTEQP